MNEGLMSRPYRALTSGIVALISLIGFEYLAIATAMPAVARALDGLSLYTLAFGGPMATSVIGMVLSGGWCDRGGPRAPLWTGVAAFVTGLLLAGMAPSMALLVTGRLVQGLGGGLLSVALYVIVARAYPAALHPRIFAAFAAAWVVPVIVGPALAGWIVETLGWRWVFFSAVIVALPAALAVQAALRGRALPNPAPTAPQHARLWWALAAAGSAGLMYWAGQQGEHAGWLLPLTVIALALSARQLLPAGTLLAGRGLPAVVALRGLAAAAFFGCEVFIPLLLSGERGLSLTQAGLVLTVGALGWSAGSWWQARPGRAPRVLLLRNGMAAIALGILAMLALLWPAVPLALGVAGWIAAGLGMGVVYPTLSVLTLELSEPSQQGTNSSALQLSDSLFSATALALSGALFAALLPQSAMAGYVAGLLLAAGFAVAGVVVAGRTEAGIPVRGTLAAA
ncbi:MFS transporter [Solimonas sp. K1W22B-7]|uniref:MFS transporter n=1 Tax=Solimonas sp. K1W22B-7 TaxID=2303331 RepID=UPI00196937BD|nr:MFS transporter [Solimonas sp. K1W22B-7]